MYADPNGDGKSDDTEIRFVSWDRASYRWKEPVFVATAGNFGPRPPAPCLSVTRDAQTGAYGAAWVDPSNKIVHLAVSKDGGVTWTGKTLLTSPTAIAGASIAFGGGKAYFSVESDSRNALIYMTGALDEEPETWKSFQGAPALAYWQRDRNGNLWTLVFWRPGGDPPTKVPDTGGSTYPPDGVILAFAGTQPRIMLDSRLDRAQIS